jgi:hypothetical protein
LKEIRSKGYSVVNNNDWVYKIDGHMFCIFTGVSRISLFLVHLVMINVDSSKGVLILLSIISYSKISLDNKLRISEQGWKIFHRRQKTKKIAVFLFCNF